MSVIDMIKTSLKYDEDMLRKITKLRVNSQEQTLTLKIENGKKYYYIKKRGESKPTYVKPDKMGEVNRIRRARFIEESKAVINNNIKLQKEFIDKYVPTDFASLNARLPKAYRYYEGEAAPTHKKNVTQSQNPYKREELIHRTSFGLYVRSKTEVMISEILETAGLEYYSDRPLELTDEKGDKKTIYPGFTIVLGKECIMYWEHKGMYGDEKYFEHDQRKMQLYYRSGIYEPKNLIVTMDGPDGSIDIERIKMIVYGLLLPLRASMENGDCIIKKIF